MSEVINIDFRKKRTVANGWVNISNTLKSNVFYLLDPKREKLCLQIAALFWKSRKDIQKVSIDSEETLSFYIHDRLYKYCGCVSQWSLTIDPIVFMKKVIEYQQNNNETFYYEDITLLYKEGDYVRFYTSAPWVKVIYLWKEKIESDLQLL